MNKRTFIEMRVAGIALDPSNNAPIVLLSDVNNKSFLPIWIGVLEASSIAAALEDIKLDRPMTHDLLCSAINSLGARVVKVEINDIKQSIYYADIVIERSGETKSLDSRPSDAIAIALRTGSRIFVSSHVLKENSAEDSLSKGILGFEQNKDKLQDILERMDPEDFGKFRA